MVFGPKRRPAVLSSPACLSALPAPFMLRENSKTRRALWRVDGKAEDVGLPAQVKDDNAASGVPERRRACAPLSADAMIVINEIRKNSK